MTHFPVRFPLSDATKTDTIVTDNDQRNTTREAQRLDTMEDLDAKKFAASDRNVKPTDVVWCVATYKTCTKPRTAFVCWQFMKVTRSINLKCDELLKLRAAQSSQRLMIGLYLADWGFPFLQ